MRRGNPILAVMLLAALALAAPVWAQEPPARPQPPAIDPGNTEGLSPAAISCMETRTGGAAQETAHQSWDGGKIPQDFCPHGRTLRLYDLDHYSPDPDTDTKAGGDD